MINILSEFEIYANILKGGIIMGIQETPQGLIVSVRVKPGSPGLRIYMKGEDIVLELTSPPKEGRANQEIMRELPRLLRCEVQILRGNQSQQNLLLLKRISQEEFEAVLEVR